MGLRAEFKAMTEDPLFWRVVMFLWGLPFVGIFVLALMHLDEFCGSYWLLVFPAAFAALGGWLVYSAIFADKRALEKRLDFLADGGDILGIVFIIAVAILAIPIWGALRVMLGPAED